MIFFPNLSFSQSEDEQAAETLVYAGRVVGDDSRARLLLEFSASPDIEIHYLDRPQRIIIDLKDTKFTINRDELQPRGLLNDIRFGAMSADHSRLVIMLDAAAVIESSDIQELENETYRLVLDINVTSDDEFNAALAEQDWQAPEVSLTDSDERPTKTKQDDFILVIDPGHGGIDGGAEGQNGAVEKEITLAFANELKAALIDNDGFKIIITRTEDKFLSLSSRVRIARAEQADLFISIHADSIRQQDLRGASIYTLSNRASDAVTAALANSENFTDVVAGLQIDDAPDDVTGILVDLARRETKVFSNIAADQVVASFDGQIRLINNPHRRAGFRVLQAPDVPSVLIELGFLSNVTDEALLTSQEWRARAIDLLIASIQDYASGVMARRK